MEIVTLKNGLKIGNFSSPHPFTFDDGTILPAVSDAKAKRLAVNFIEDYATHLFHRQQDQDLMIETVELRFELTDEIKEEIDKWVTLYELKKVHFVLVPLPMLTAMKGIVRHSEYQWPRKNLLQSPFRCIRIADRTKKLVSSTKFCI